MAARFASKVKTLVSVLLSVLDRFGVPNVVVGYNRCLLSSLSGFAPVTPDSFRYRLCDNVCLFQQADHRLFVGGNLLWPPNSFWLLTASCVA